MVVAGRVAINRNLEPDRSAIRCRPKNQMEVASVEPVNNATAFLIQDGMFSANRPIAGQSPFVESQRPHRIVVGSVLDRAVRCDEVLPPLVTDVGLRR